MSAWNLAELTDHAKRERMARNRGYLLAFALDLGFDFTIAQRLLFWRWVWLRRGLSARNGENDGGT